MKKVLVVGAILAAIASSAQAQSSVTIYGVADAAVQVGNGGGGFSQNSKTGVRTDVNDNRHFTGVQSGGWSGSRIGFKGEEDLGNKVKAVFTLEYGTDLDTGTGLTQSRQSYVGLSSGDYGTLTLGRQYAPSGVLISKNSAFDISGATPMNQFLNGKSVGLSALGGTMGTGEVSRWNNSIAYQSPVFNGFSSRVAYALGETGNTTGFTKGVYDPASANTASAETTDNGKFGVSGSYANGPLNVDVIYQTVMNVTSTYPKVDTQGSDVQEWYVGGGYDFKFVKVVASYQTLNNKNSAASAIDSKVWSVGAIVPVTTNGKVRVEYAQTKFSQSGEQPVAELRTNGSSSGWGVGYTHDLSKRTMLYTNYSYITNDKDSMDFGANGIGARGESNYTITAGIKHTF